jgi:DNA-binding phage protein
MRGKSQTSKKPGKSLKPTSKVKGVTRPRLKTGSAAYDYSAASELANRKFISEAIADALLDGDADAVREILLSHLEQVHKDEFYKQAGISRRALFKLMEPNANPTLESLAKVCKALSDAA